ncbi:sialic acid-binding Ig-like lectin 13 isoform X2 [Lissotriton helveticus]
MGFVRLLVIFFLWKGVLVAPKDYTLTAPWNVTAQEGLCVLIPCQFTYEHTGEAAVTSRGYWFVQQYRENKAVASNDERKDIFEEARGRFKLVGDVRRRDCSLSISDVRRWDGRNYYFKYEHNDYTTTEYSYIHYIVPVTVVDMKSPNWLLLVIIGGVVLAGLSLLAWLMISKGRRSMNETSIDTTVHSTYQELQGRQQDIYCELMRDRN